MVRDTLLRSIRDVSIRVGQLSATATLCFFPLFGRDITEANLPQEVARDRRTISFVKGCYLGQETVARIDALGHVNKTLASLRYLQPHIPAPGDTLYQGEEAVGKITSATWSPRLNAPVALGYLRRGFNTPGTRLTSNNGPAAVEVVSLNSPEGQSAAE